MKKSTNKLINLIQEIVKQEVKKEVENIFIREGVKAMTEQSVTPMPKPKPKPRKEVSYTKNPMLNDILNETARAGELDEYPSMGGGTYDTSKMSQLMGYGDVIGDAETKRQNAAIATAQAARADTSNPAVQNVMDNLSRDYRDVMKAVDKKKGKA
tara:strand:- start:1399 stop:1863 length:465 start_codon:yes stop_codon:yes gene_type:complete